MKKSIEIEVPIFKLSLNEEGKAKLSENFDKLDLYVSELKIIGKTNSLVIIIGTNGKANMPKNNIKAIVDNKLSFYLFQNNWINDIKYDNKNNSLIIEFTQIKEK